MEWKLCTRYVLRSWIYVLSLAQNEKQTTNRFPITCLHLLSSSWVIANGWMDGSFVVECIVRRRMGQASGRVYYCWWQKETETLIDFVLPFNSHAWPNSRSRRNSLHFDYLAEQSSDKPKPPSCARHMPHVVNYCKTTRCSNAYLVAWIPFVPSILFHLSVVYFSRLRSFFFFQPNKSKALPKKKG